MLDTNELERAFSEDGAGNWTRRIRYSLDEAFRRERAAAGHGISAPRQLIDAWRAGTVSDAFLTRMSLADATKPWLARVDVTENSPWQYRYTQHMSSPYGHFRGESLAEVTASHPFPSHVTSAMLDYHSCKQTQQPTYFEIEQVVDGIYRAYTRLMVPLQGRRGKLSEVAYAIRYTAEPSSVPEPV